MVKGTKGEEREIFLLKKHVHAPRVKEDGKIIAKVVRRDIRTCTYKRQGEVVLAGDCSSRIGKACDPN